jgi:glycosyltransferase involved in cell wall biosynthesis
MRKPEVTVVIDTYNQERYIGAAIQSVLDQDYPCGQVEIIVVDDGSTDDTAGEVGRYKQRVSYIRQENQGQAAAINAGVERAGGEIVALLDGDDLWYRTKLKQVVRAFEQDPAAGLVFHNTKLCAGGGERPAQFLCPFFIPASAITLRRRFLEKLLPLPVSFRSYADLYLTYHMPFFARICPLKDCLGECRVGGAHHSKNQRDDIAMLELHKRSLGERLDRFMFQCLEVKSGEELLDSLFFIMQQLEQIHASSPGQSDSSQMIHLTTELDYAEQRRQYTTV